MKDKAKADKQFSSKTYESPLFNTLLGDTLHPGGLSLTERVGELSQLEESSLVLDIACGKGVTACFLARQYGCHVIGIDLSAELLSLARNTAQRERLSDKVEFFTGDGERLPYKDSLFDAVISECSFSLLPNKSVAAVEIRRVLKTGSRLVMTDVFLRGQLSEGLRTQAGFASCIAGAKTIDEYIKLFEELGFSHHYVEDHSEALMKVAYQAVVTYGSWEAFAGQVWEAARNPVEQKDGIVEGTPWKVLFKEGRPGYALLVFTKPDG